MRLKVKQSFGDNELIMSDVTALEIDGQPYVPPAKPSPQRWSEEVECCGYDSGRAEIHTIGTQSPHVFRNARAKLGFDSDGHVWFADSDAQSLAECLRLEAMHYKDQSDHAPQSLLRAAERLAGPEQD